MGLAVPADPGGWPAEEPGAGEPARGLQAGGASGEAPASGRTVPSASALYFGVWGNSVSLGLGE